MPGGDLAHERKTGNLMKSPFKFKKYGQSGIEVSEIFPHLGECVDDMCIVKSVFTEIPNHEPALEMMNYRAPTLPAVLRWARGLLTASER